MARSHKAKIPKFRKKQKVNIDRVGLAVPPRNFKIIDIKLFANYLLGAQQSGFQPSLENRLVTDSDVSFEDRNTCDERSKNCKTGLFESKRNITSYTQLYSSDHTSDKEVEDTSPKFQVSASVWHKDESSQSTSSPDTDHYMTSCCSFSLLEDEFENKLSLDGVDWGNCLYCNVDNFHCGV